MIATTTKAKIKPVRLLERHSSQASRVDRQKGIIYGVKLVGFESRNTARVLGLDPKEFNGALDHTYAYSPYALSKAAKLYEGAPVRFDHPPSTITPSGARIITNPVRPCLSVIGEVRNAALGEDGLYGDVHLLLTHPHADFVLEVAERMPDKLAISHNAAGKPELENGRVVITEIVKVASCDLIGDVPGTTNGLFESALDDNPVTRKDRKMSVTEMTVEDLRAEALAIIDGDGSDADKLDSLRALLGEEASAPAAGAMESMALIESLGREISAVRVQAVAAVRPGDRKALVESWPKKGSDRAALRPHSSAALMEYHSEPQAKDAEEFSRRLLSHY
jgi:hypothetical protein